MMDGTGQQPACATCSIVEEGSSLLLALPVFLLHQVLGMLEPDDLLQLLQTSKGMAKEVMQHSSGRLTLKVHVSQQAVKQVKAQQGINMAAIRRVLQWAPPACLKVMLIGSRLMCKANRELISSVFGAADPSPESHEGQDMQQLPSIMEVCIQNFSLPSLVPAEVAAACPNLRTLHLQECEILWEQHETSSRFSDISANSSSNNVIGPSIGVCPAHQLHTLVLHNVIVCHIVQEPFTKARVAQSMPSAIAAQFAEQVRRSVSNVRCSKLLGRTSGADFLEVIGPQLIELHALQGHNLWDAQGISEQLQKLQKLVAPDVSVKAAADMEQLLSLPNLTHVELGSVWKLQEDYSTRACKWQYLKLHLRAHEAQSLLALSKLPLYSLTQPLTLASSDSRSNKLYLELPSSVEPDSLAVLQRLAQQLQRCGVKLMSPGLVWQAPFDDPFLAGAQLAASFRVIAPAIGHQESIMLRHMTIDQPILEAVAAVYRDSLKRLSCGVCSYTADMQPAWHAGLSGLPALDFVRLAQPINRDLELLDCIRSLAAAVAQQPERRCIRVAQFAYSQVLTLQSKHGAQAHALS